MFYLYRLFHPFLQTSFINIFALTSHTNAFYSIFKLIEPIELVQLVPLVQGFNWFKGSIGSRVQLVQNTKKVTKLGCLILKSYLASPLTTSKCLGRFQTWLGRFKPSHLAFLKGNCDEGQQFTRMVVDIIQAFPHIYFLNFIPYLNTKCIATDEPCPLYTWWRN